MLVTIKEIKYRYDGGGLGKSYDVYYCQTCMPHTVQWLQVFGEDELDAYRNFKPTMYEKYGLTVFVNRDSQNP